MANGSPYVDDFNAASAAVAKRLPHGPWRLAYQSRSGSPHRAGGGRDAPSRDGRQRSSTLHRRARRARATESRGGAVRLVVVGGGIAGLTAAHRAVEISRERETALELTVLEARDRLGGTIETEHAGGFLVETGPDSFLSEKPWALA